MDNFKISKSKKVGRPRNSVDGMLAKKPAAKSASNTAPARGVIGDFKQKDGFHPYDQAKLGISKKSKSTLGQDIVDDEPIVLDEVKPAKKEKLDWRSRFTKKGRALRREQKGKKKRSRKKIILITLAVLLTLLAAGAGYAYKKLHGVLKGGAAGAAALNANVDPTLLKGEGDGRVNVLIMGKGGPGHDGPDLTDTLLIASIDPVQKQAALLSVPRDLFVLSNGAHVKINSIYANAKYSVLAGPRTKDIKERAEKAGFDAIKSKIQEVLGIPIHYQIMVDFTAFRQAIDAVGGVTINAPQALYDTLMAPDNGGNPLLVKKGVQHLDGKHALFYAQSRHSTARGDFDRTERQRQVLVALKDRVLSLGTFSNPVTIARLINAFGSHVRTDFTQAEIMRVYDIGKQIDSSKVKSIGLADPPNNFLTTGNMFGQSVVLPTAGLDNYTAIRAFVRNALRDSFLQKENARVVILNGTNRAGLASSVSTTLKSYGYNVIKAADAPTKNYTNTTVVDLTGGVDKYTKHYLETRFKVTATSGLPDSKINITKDTADFVIILGQNESNNSQN